MNILIHTDGGSRGNPGQAAIGVVIELSGVPPKEIAAFGKSIGIATNNEAEYSAVLAAMEWLKDNQHNPHVKGLSCYFFLDSQLVVRQLTGLYKIKNARLSEYLLSIKQLEQEINTPIVYREIPREQNVRADELVNQALDSL